MAGVQKISNWFDAGWKIISAVIIIVGAIFSFAKAWINIESNADNIEEAKKDFNRELELQERRNENRFNRSSEWNQERRQSQKEVEERIRDIELELEYLKAKNEKSN